MFSSTMVAASAIRACTSHDSGNTRLRNAEPVRYTRGMVDMATSERPTWIWSIFANANTNVSPDIITRGPNVSSNWIERMSLLAREMT